MTEGSPDEARNVRKQTDAIEGARRIDSDGGQSICLGTDPGTARVLRGDSPADQPGGGHDHSQRAGCPTAKPLPGQRYIEEHWYQDRVVAEARPGAGPSLQPGTDRV